MMYAGLRVDSTAAGRKVIMDKCPHCGGKIDGDSCGRENREMRERFANRRGQEDLYVMTLLARGMTRRQVAAELNTTQWIVNHAVDRVLGLLGADNTTEAAVRLTAAGLIDPLAQEGV